MNTSAESRAGGGVGCLVGIVLGLVFLATTIVLFILGAGKEGHGAYLAGAAACLALATGVPITIAVRQGNRDARAAAEVLATGPRVDAPIVEVRHGATSRAVAYRIVARGTNPVTGAAQDFVGPTLRRDPALHLRGRTTVSIAVDPADPTRGVMDLAFLPGGRPVGWTVCGGGR